MTIDDWNIRDINSDKELETIAPISARARSLLARNRTKPLLAKYGLVNVLGAIEMLEGLEYYHDNIVRISSTLATGSKIISATAVDHEAIAYINRLGQFYFFAKSNFVKTAIPDFATLIPTISRFQVFRNKHAAHRSIDAPRNESEDEKVAHARALSPMLGTLYSPKPNAPPMKQPKMGVAIEREELEQQMQRELWTCNFRTFQTFDTARGSAINFTVEIEHPKIMAEAYTVVERSILYERASQPA
jgi:hypothetical protein